MVRLELMAVSETIRPSPHRVVGKVANYVAMRAGERLNIHAEAVVHFTLCSFQWKNCSKRQIHCINLRMSTCWGRSSKCLKLSQKFGGSFTIEFVLKVRFDWMMERAYLFIHSRNCCAAWFGLTVLVWMHWVCHYWITDDDYGKEIAEGVKWLWGFWRLIKVICMIIWVINLSFSG